MMVMKGLTFHHEGFSVLDEGVEFVGLFYYGHVREFVMAIGDFYELYGV